ncbi:MAG: hypothetical protein ACI3Z0_01560 [Candidatus Cryptobacteroides sp.]
MKKVIIVIMLFSICFGVSAQSRKPIEKADTSETIRRPRLTIGGYGEVAASYNFYSDSPYRYMYPDRYVSSPGYGRLDIPHAVISLGYDFGRGWSMGTEIEFEHGGVEVSTEVEGDEAVELEQEVERGGEIFLEQFWLQKRWKDAAVNLRAGMIIVPVGLTNNRHEPDGFFTVYRQEGESTILPCTWHQIGLSLWGRVNGWRYELQLLPGLNSRLFNTSNWINGGSASPYEFTVFNSPAAAFRIDNYSVRNLRIGLSGYAGGTNNDAYPRLVDKNGNASVAVKGTAMVAALDFEYLGRHVTARGNADFGYLSNASAIGTSNKNSDNSTFSPYEHSFVGQKAFSAGVEAGLDIFSYIGKLHKMNLFVFGRYEAYDSYIPASGVQDYRWSDRQRIAFGINYRPLRQIIVKAEYSCRFLPSGYNREQSINIGICYAGFFEH